MEDWGNISSDELFTDISMSGPSGIMADQQQQNTAPNSDALEDFDASNFFELLNQVDADPSKDPKISILESEKDRGKPYRVTGSQVTVGPYVPMKFLVEGGSAGMSVHSTLRFEDENFEDKPVVCDKCPHASYTGCGSHEDHNTANFCITTKDAELSYHMDNLHPTAALKLKDNKPVKFALAFKCLVSCSELTHYTKSPRILKMELVDGQGNVLANNEWSVRVCKAVGRDHKYRLEGKPKRQSTNTDIIFAKKMKVEEEEPVVHVIDESQIIYETSSPCGPMFGNLSSGISYEESVVSPSQSFLPKNEQQVLCEAGTSQLTGMGNAKMQLAVCEPQELPQIELQAVSSPAAQPVVNFNASSACVFQMRNENDRKVVTDLVKALGGDVFRCIPE